MASRHIRHGMSGSRSTRPKRNSYEQDGKQAQQRQEALLHRVGRHRHGLIIEVQLETQWDR